MKTIICNEIDAKLPEYLEDLDKKLQKIILGQGCVNCKKPPSNKIDYVLCTNGEIRWWHYRSDLVESCIIRRK